MNWLLTLSRSDTPIVLSEPRVCWLVEMKTVKCRGMVLGMAVMALAALVSAQITFSRDWTGGKRAAPQVALDCGQFARLCRHFVHELKAAMTSEISASDKRRRSDEPPVYDEE